MKKILLILTILIANSMNLSAQGSLPKGYWHQDVVEIDGEKVVNIHVLPIYKYARGIDRRRYERLIRSVKRVYPIAKIAREEMADMEEVVASLPTKKEQEAYIDTVYDRIKSQYAPELKRMTVTDGRILLRLIERETEYTAYNLLFEFRGRFVAGFWQGVSKMFGHNLKSEFGDSEEDKMIEQIIIYYEAGLL